MPSSLDSLIQYLSSQRPWWQGGTTREWIDPKASWWSRIQAWSWNICLSATFSYVSLMCHDHPGCVQCHGFEQLNIKSGVMSTRMPLWSNQGSIKSATLSSKIPNSLKQQETVSFMSLYRAQRGHFPHIPLPNTDPTPLPWQDSLELGLSCASKTSMLPKEERQQDPETAHVGHISSKCRLYSLGTPLCVRWLGGNPARLNRGSDLFLLKESNVEKWRSNIGQPATLQFKCLTAAGQSSEVHTSAELVLATRAIFFQFVLLLPSYVISCHQTIDVHNMMARKWATGIGRRSCIP